MTSTTSFEGELFLQPSFDVQTWIEELSELFAKRDNNFIAGVTKHSDHTHVTIDAWDFCDTHDAWRISEALEAVGTETTQGSVITRTWGVEEDEIGKDPLFIGQGDQLTAIISTHTLKGIINELAYLSEEHTHELINQCFNTLTERTEVTPNESTN